MSFCIANLGHLSHHDLDHIGIVIGSARGMVDCDPDEAAKEKVSDHTGFHDRGHGGASDFETGLVADHLQVIVGALDLNGAWRSEEPFAFGINELTGGARNLRGLLSSFDGNTLLSAPGDGGATAQDEGGSENSAQG